MAYHHLHFGYQIGLLIIYSYTTQARHTGIYNNEKKMIEGTGSVYKTININLTNYYKNMIT